MHLFNSRCDVLCLASVLAACLTGVAHADSFVIQSGTSPSGTFSFQVEPTMLPSDLTGEDYFAAVADSAAIGQFSVDFGDSSYPLDLGISTFFGQEFFTGDQLFSGGDGTAPIAFIAGNYDLVDLTGTAYTLTISSDTAVTPEPSTLILVSFGLCSLSMVVLRTRHGGLPSRFNNAFTARQRVQAELVQG